MRVQGFFFSDFIHPFVYFTPPYGRKKNEKKYVIYLLFILQYYSAFGSFFPSPPPPPLILLRVRGKPPINLIPTIQTKRNRRAAAATTVKKIIVIIKNGPPPPPPPPRVRACVRAINIVRGGGPETFGDNGARDAYDNDDYNVLCRRRRPRFHERNVMRVFYVRRVLAYCVRVPTFTSDSTIQHNAVELITTRLLRAALPCGFPAAASVQRTRVGGSRGDAKRAARVAPKSF